MILVVAAALLDVLGAVCGVLLGLTGAALVILGAFSASEGTVLRGLTGALVGGALFAGGLYLVGFL